MRRRAEEQALPRWKTASDVRRVAFSVKRDRKGRPVDAQGRWVDEYGVRISELGLNVPFRIGGHARADVYAGTVALTGRSKQRVAIKVFNLALSDKDVHKFRGIITDLRSAHVKLPKMDFVLVPVDDLRHAGIPIMPTAISKEHENMVWVQVSQLFGSLSGSKIENKARLSDVKTAREGAEFMTELTKAANAGYIPPQDLVEPFIQREKGVIPFDLDQLIYLKSPNAVARAQRLREYLMEMLESPAFGGRETALGQFFANVALNVANPEMREALQAVFADYLVGRNPR